MKVRELYEQPQVRIPKYGDRFSWQDAVYILTTAGDPEGRQWSFINVKSGFRLTSFAEAVNTRGSWDEVTRCARAQAGPVVFEDTGKPPVFPEDVTPQKPLQSGDMIRMGCNLKLLVGQDADGQGRLIYLEGSTPGFIQTHNVHVGSFPGKWTREACCVAGIMDWEIVSRNGSAS